MVAQLVGLFHHLLPLTNSFPSNFKLISSYIYVNFCVKPLHSARALRHVFCQTWYTKQKKSTTSTDLIRFGVVWPKLRPLSALGSRLTDARRDCHGLARGDMKRRHHVGTATSRFCAKKIGCKKRDFSILLRMLINGCVYVYTQKSCKKCCHFHALQSEPHQTKIYARFSP